MHLAHLTHTFYAYVQCTALKFPVLSPVGSLRNNETKSAA